MVNRGRLSISLKKKGTQKYALSHEKTKSFFYKKKISILTESVFSVQSKFLFRNDNLCMSMVFLFIILFDINILSEMLYLCQSLIRIDLFIDQLFISSSIILVCRCYRSNSYGATESCSRLCRLQYASTTVYSNSSYFIRK